MGNIYLVITSFFMCLTLTAQQTYVPDDNFEQFLIDVGVDDVLDNYVLTNNISAVKILNLNNKEIRDITGVEDFIALETLNCSLNQINNIDVSKNKSLTKLNCSNNQIRTLNVSANTALTELYCDTNVNLESLDISANESLTILSCKYNMNLNSLDVSACINLKKLYCHSNNNLSNLNVSNNSALEELYCHTNSLTSLDVSTCTALTNLHCHWNNISTLEVKENAALEQLYCYGNDLNSLDVSANSILTELICDNNNLSSLDVSKNTSLKFLGCGFNSIERLDLSENSALTRIYCSYNNLTSLNVKNGNNTNLTIFNTTNNPNLECIQVDDVDYMNTNWSSGKDTTAIFSENCENLSVSDLTEFNFQIYPNPVNDVLNIELNTGLELKQINIYNIQSQYLFSTQELKIDTKSLTSGMYFIEVETNKGKSVKKIVVE